MIVVNGVLIDDTLTDNNAWYLVKEPKNIIWKDKEEAQEIMRKNHPHLYAMMKRHERMAV